MAIDFSYRHLLLASLLLSVGASAQISGRQGAVTVPSEPQAVEDDSLATVDDIVEGVVEFVEVEPYDSDRLAEEKKRYRERSVRLYEEVLASAVRNPYQPNKTESVARLFREYEKAHPIDTVTYTSEWLSDEFIQGYYYYLPLLDKYAQHTREFTGILNSIIGNLEKQLADSKIPIFKRGTQQMLTSLLKSGKFKTKRGEYLLSYGPVYSQREEGASIPYLDGLLTEVIDIVDKITPRNAEASLAGLNAVKEKLEIKIEGTDTKSDIGNSTRVNVPADGSRNIEIIDNNARKQPAPEKNGTENRNNATPARPASGSHANTGKSISGGSDASVQPRRQQPIYSTDDVVHALAALNNKYLDTLKDNLQRKAAGRLRMFMQDLAEMYGEFRNVMKAAPNFSGIRLSEEELRLSENNGKATTAEIDDAAEMLDKEFKPNDLRKLIRKGDVIGYARSLNELYNSALKIQKSYPLIF